MTRKFTITLIMALALAVSTDMAQAEDVKYKRLPAPEDLVRKYECTDLVIYGEIPEPYIFIEVFSLAGLDKLNEEELASWREILISYVKIDDQELSGTAYQQGLDYRIDFETNRAHEKELAGYSFSIIIEKDGNADFYSFLYAEEGEITQPERQLECKRIK